MNGTAFDVYYEHLLLLSFWSDVKNEVERSPGHSPIRTGEWRIEQERLEI